MQSPLQLPYNVIVIVFDVMVIGAAKAIAVNIYTNEMEWLANQNICIHSSKLSRPCW